jgi:hypothetical protein
MRKLSFRGVLAAICMISFARVCAAEVRIVDGAEPGFWNNRAVVIGTISDLDTDKGETAFRLDVACVILTEIPLNAQNKMAVKGAFFVESAIDADVSNGSLVMLCVNRAGDGWEIENNGISYNHSFLMPKGSSALVLKSFDDPQVAIICDNIRKAYLASTCAVKSTNRTSAK